MVGWHTDYREDGRRADQFRSPPNWHDFYDLAKTWPDWTPEGQHVAIVTS
jgi:hypothetical protein